MEEQRGVYIGCDRFDRYIVFVVVVVKTNGKLNVMGYDGMLWGLVLVCSR